MLRQLIAAAICFLAGYVIGATFGFKAAVVDYVEHDAKKIEEMADSIYADRYGEQEIPESVAQQLQAAVDETDESDDDSSTESKGFQ